MQFSITLIIIIVTAMASISAFSNQILMDKMMFNAYMVKHRKEWWRFFTSGFVHADYIHLALNMFVLYSFGSFLESAYSDFFEDKAHFYFITLYLLSLVACEITSYRKNINNVNYNSLGASGAVSAVVFACIIIEPFSQLSVYGIKMPAVVYGLLYLALEFYLNKAKRTNINHTAHIEGALFGIVFTIVTKPALFSNFVEQVKNHFGS
ncbi:MAG: rhomboid family intramembrane serine protease [Bacteroidota bacterium]|nr:rhomboid family intramembrane serine protease [Bacteroidota bacterium]